MKYLVLGILIVFSLCCAGQEVDEDTEANLCERLTSEAILNLEGSFATLSVDSVKQITQKLVYNCGTSEFSQRCLIVKCMLGGEPTDELFRDYLDDNLHIDLLRRQHYSELHDYGYEYYGAPYYFDYFPLRHKLDSLITEKAYELLDSGMLTHGEELICVLFTEGLLAFEEEMEKRKFRDTEIRKSMHRSYRRNGDYYMRCNFYSGLIQPLKADDVFGLNPFFGLSLSSPMEYRTVVDFGFKVRLNNDDRKFSYFANDQLNEVDSKSNLNIGLSFSRRVNNHDKLRIYPKVGLGLEVIDTGLSGKEEEDDEEETSYNIETFNLTTGISILSPVFKTSYIGLGVNYHFVPYGLDKDLKTPISSNLISTELFYRF